MPTLIQERPPPRLLPLVPLPPSAYIPRRSPRPSRDAAATDSGAATPPVEALTATEWGHNFFYSRGIDLFNFGYYWEAHEAWEALWHKAGRAGLVADFLKGLIALAAAGVKAREGSSAGARAHAGRARQLFESIAKLQPDYMGQSPAALARWAGQIANDPGAIIDLSPDPVRVVMPFALPLVT